jgi:hypothetical protein
MPYEPFPASVLFALGGSVIGFTESDPVGEKSPSFIQAPKIFIAVSEDIVVGLGVVDTSKTRNWSPYECKPSIITEDLNTP